MLRWVIATTALLLAAGGFLGAGPTPGGPFNPFGWLFVGLAALVWFEWAPIKAGLDQRPGLFDAFTRNILGTTKCKTSSGGGSTS
jgi:hypothetical protein